MKPILLLAGLLLNGMALGQSFHAFQNISPTYLSAAENPALASGGSYRMSFLLTSASAQMNSNCLYGNLNQSTWQVISGQAYWNSEKWLADTAYGVSLTGRRRSGKISGEAVVNLPGVLWQIHPRVAVFTTWRYRQLVQADDISEGALRLFLGVMPDLSLLNKINGSFQTALLEEKGLGLAVRLADRGEQRLQAGITLKSWSVRQLEKLHLTELQVNEGRITGGLSRWQRPVSGIGPAPIWGAGAQVSLDLGFVWEHRPYRLRSRYEVNNPKGKNRLFSSKSEIGFDQRIQLSILDIGPDLSLSSYPDFQTIEYTMDVPFNPEAFDGKNALNYLLENAQKVKIENRLRLRPPTSLQIGIEQFLGKGYWFQGAFRWAPRFKNDPDVLQLASARAVMISVSKQHRYWSVSAPLVYTPEVNRVDMGLWVRTGPLSFGTNTLGSLFRKEVYRASVQASLCWNVRYRRAVSMERFTW